jgi:hypothetical protein
LSKIKAKVRGGSLLSSGLVVLVLLGLAVSVVISGGGPTAVLPHCTGYEGETCPTGQTPFHGPDILPGSILGGPDITVAGGFLDMIVRGTDRRFYRVFWDGSSWKGPFLIGGLSNADGTARVNGLRGSFYRVDFFSIGTDGALWHAYVVCDDPGSTTFHGWEKIGGGFIGGVDAAWQALSGGGQQLSAFGRGLDNALWQVYWSGFSWVFNRIGGNLTSDPGAVGNDFNRLDVFWRGNDATLRHIYWNGFTWSGVNNLGGQLNGGPDPLRRALAPGKPIEVFLRGTNNKLFRVRWNGTSWSGTESVGGGGGFDSTSDPGATSFDFTKRVDVVFRGPSATTGGPIHHTWKP